MPHRLSGHAALDSLSNLAASLNAGKDKQAGDAFFIPALARDQIESLYRGDWLARKIVDIVPYDCVREWRAWAGEASAVARVKAIESRLNLRRAVQRAMVMGRLYGGGALLLGTRETDPTALATELRPEGLGEGGLAFLHPVSRWQLAVDAIERDPLSPWYGEPKSYQVTAPERGPLVLHPSRVIRFLGAPLADPALTGADTWSDPVLVALYDAIHAVALTTAGATSLMHEAKVDVVTVPNLSEHLSNAATTAQLSARFGYAAAMKSLNNLLLLGDGETWARQRVDFAGLPEMVRTFLQVAAGAADIPVTRLLGQSPAGLSATDDGGRPAEDGTDATGVAMPAGGAGLRGWLSGVYGKLPGLGRAAAAASLPVVLASDQGPIPNPSRLVVPGSLANSGDTVVLPVDGMNTAFLQFLGTAAWSSTLVFEVSGDGGTTWTATNLVPWGGGAPTGSVVAGAAAVPQLFEAACGGPTHIRVRAAAAITNGPVTVIAAAASGLKSLRVGSVDGGFVTLGAQADAAAASDAGTASLVALVKRGLGRWTALLALLPAAIGRTTSAGSFPVVLASDHAAVPATIGKAATAGDASVAAGGTAQVLFSGATPANGWKVANPDPAEDLWVSDSATAAPNGLGSYRLPAGGILTTEPGEKPCGPVSVYGATTGHPITARAW